MVMDEEFVRDGRINSSLEESSRHGESQEPIGCCISADDHLSLGHQWRFLELMMGDGHNSLCQAMDLEDPDGRSVMMVYN